MHDSQLTEVLVERHQYLPPRARQGEYALHRPDPPTNLRPSRHRAPQSATRTRRRPTHRRRAESSRFRGLGERRLNAFVSDHAPGVHQACTNVVGLQPRVALQDNLRSIAGRQHPEHVLDRQTAVLDDWFATEYARVRGDSTKEVDFADRMSHVAPRTMLSRATLIPPRQGDDADATWFGSGRADRRPRRASGLPTRPRPDAHSEADRSR